MIIKWLFCSGESPNKIRVVVGQYNLENIDEKEMAFDVESVFHHEKFQDAFDGPLSHDLALVKLRRKPDGLGAR